MAIEFKKAGRGKLKLRLALAGPSGSGKTYTSLALAAGLGGKTAVIDTERCSAAKYAEYFDFDVAEMDAPFHPDRLTEAVADVAKAGYDNCLIDSLSHFWAGPGGLLELVDKFAAQMKTRNTFVAWKRAGPIQNKMVESILQAPMNMLWCMRSKQEYAVEKDQKSGKATVSKLGLAPVQRDGIEYEADIFAEMDMDHNFIVAKTRMFDLTDAVINKPNKELGVQIGKWLNKSK